MFTIEQIKSAHAKVKSGADFPAYVQELRELGILFYEHFLSDGRTIYHGKNGFELSGPVKWATMQVAPKGNPKDLKYFLGIHQAGQTDYLSFCEQAASSGVEKWVVDIVKMKCIYFDLRGNQMVVEEIPELKRAF
jgi:uncharacterized protein YbcV (DUF1398 family)